ncbi:MAG: radical SAM protein [Candidatus Bathyarchaeota archaeon]|nr:MAG: radical SAM protein [Candidatus Bathyarchaeota archaeon]
MNFKWLLEADEKEFEVALKKAQTVSWRNFGRKIRFYAPSFVYYRTDYYCSSPAAFPSISITGSSCSLKCKHCGGIILNTMYPANSPEELVKLCIDLKRKGAVGCLISGGCLPDGSLPLERFMDAMEEIKRDLGLTMFIHTGVVRKDVAKQLKTVGIDAALIDIIGSDETIREVYSLDVSVSDYENSLRVLHDVNIPTVPHVLVGLHYGRLKGELQALKIIARYNPSAVIIIAFMPIRGTMMEEIMPPMPSVIGKVLVAARFMMPSIPLALGCMRPRGIHRTETDVLAVKAGVNGIAFPAEDAIRLAESLGYEVSFSSLCCSQIIDDLRKQGEN